MTIDHWIKCHLTWEILINQWSSVLECLRPKVGQYGTQQGHWHKALFNHDCIREFYSDGALEVSGTHPTHGHEQFPQRDLAKQRSHSQQQIIWYQINNEETGWSPDSFFLFEIKGSRECLFPVDPSLWPKLSSTTPIGRIVFKIGWVSYHLCLAG